MKDLKFIQKYSLLCLALLLSPIFLMAQAAEKDLSLSPYFQVKSDNPSVDRLPLQSSEAEVNIAGVIADVVVTQVYKNEGENTLEAIYVFPGSTRAAVYGMQMTIGDRTINAVIKEKGKARKDYERAKSQGKRASLLEQSRPNVFQMNVANITPGDEIKVILRYTELLVPEEGVYEFAYPTVVGPRYSEISAATASVEDQFLATPYQSAGMDATFRTDINVFISAGMSIQSVHSESHKVIVDNETLTTSRVSLDPSEKNAGNRDFVLEYCLAGGKINSGLLLYEHEDENFFLMMVQPPERVTIDQIPPREYIFVVDVSGSMAGFPLSVSKKLLRDLIVELRPTDRFNVMFFAGGYAWMAEKSMEATNANMERAVNFIDQQRGGGGTRLANALKEAVKLPRQSKSLSRSIVVVTDGYIGAEQEAFDVIRKNLNQANVFAFGIGSSVNRHLIEGIAHVGAGEPLIVLDRNEAHQQAEKFRRYINSPVLTQINTEFKDFEVYDVEPFTIPDVMAERPVLIFGKYKGRAKGEIVLTGNTGTKSYESRFAVNSVKPGVKNSALRYLWARKRIGMLDDYNRVGHDQSMVKEITNLGLKYNLLTAYTSFVAIDQEVVRKEGDKLSTVKQVQPMPQGVPDSAIGFDLGIEGVVKRSKKKQLRFGKIDSPVAETIMPVLKSKLPELQHFFKTRGITGNVDLEIVVDPKFGLVKVNVLKGKLSKEDEEALFEMIRKWRFEETGLKSVARFVIPLVQ